MQLSRKLELEVFQTMKPCEWKLGLAHEGPTPFRRRVLIKPRYIDETKPSKPITPATTPAARTRSLDDEDFQVCFLSYGIVSKF